MSIKEKSKEKKERLQMIMFMIAVVFFLILGACCLTIIIKGAVNPKSPPSVLGITPIIIQSESMSGNAPDHIEAGDLVLIGKADADIEQLSEGDIIAFMKGKVVVTHRIINIEKSEDGSLIFTTKGDADNTEDSELVTSDNIVGIYIGRIPRLGDFVMFLQKPLGIVLVIGIPVVSFIIYSIICRKKETQNTYEDVTAKRRGV